MSSERFPSYAVNLLGTEAELLYSQLPHHKTLNPESSFDK